MLLFDDDLIFQFLFHSFDIFTDNDRSLTMTIKYAQLKKDKNRLTFILVEASATEFLSLGPSHCGFLTFFTLLLRTVSLFIIDNRESRPSHL